MRRLIWSIDAIEDLKAIDRYICEFNPRAAFRIASALVDAAGNLTTFPDRGRLIRPGVREWVTVRPYVIRYVVLTEEVRVMFIRHSARRPVA